ncbi:nucleotidyltransferase [Oceanobacillus sp. J11TS1]|uniref:nucleotidyltransferase n=1 Tax=Oceanobacillus sp. J11TS1 TaxID=2807191 RepID=UPI001BB394FF|nr:nucleotidyltransferase [Oceanobacillus sp. J11TS1]
MIALEGNWIVLNYDSLSIYPSNAYLILAIGAAIIVMAYIFNRFSSYKDDTNAKDNREFINKWWTETDSKIMNWVLAIAILSLVIVAIYDWPTAFKLFYIFLFVGIAGFGFLYIMHGERVDQPDEETYKPITRKFLDLIDYRRHPFNLSFVIFVLVLISFLLSKEFGIPLDTEVSGNPRYVTSLPASAFVMSGLMLASTFVYIINNSDIFGIRKAEQNEEKVLLIHFMEIMCCGVTFFIWLVTVISAFI